MKRILILLSFLPLFLGAIQGGFDESFYRLNIEQRKAAFISKMSALFDESFEKVRQDRQFIEHIFKHYAKTGFRNLSAQEFERLSSLQQKYRVKHLFDYKEYQMRIGVVPKSMGIAQAMLESATGTSRFVREGNNLFGQYTYSGAGLIPRQRQAGKTHKIKIFSSLQESVDAYVLNLNRHAAYEEFRKLRFKFQSEGKKLGGLTAIHTLENYSEIKGQYARRLDNIIKNNDLSRFD